MESVSFIRIPKRYKNREKIPLDRHGETLASKKLRQEKNSRLKQKYLVEDVMRNRGLQQIEYENNRKLNRFRPDKSKGTVQQANQAI